MIFLPNNCKCSTPTVYPKNWKQTSASIKANWYAQYYFYDQNGNRTLKIVKAGVNRYKTARERKEAMTILLDQLSYMLKTQGVNPVTKEIVKSADSGMNFLDALSYSADKIKVAKSTASDIKSMLNYVTIRAKSLKLAEEPIIDIKRKHILAILEPIESPHKFNKYRSYFSILFENLIEPEIIENNPCLGIKKRKTVKKLREVMNQDERDQVNRHLKENYYPFWRFMQIFYHSGTREIELLRVKVKDVDLINQRFKITVLKGQHPIEMWRTIKDIALPLWTELLACSKQQHYIFSVGLKPGPTNIRREQITRRWNEHVKKKLGIDSDFYSLKHLHTTETVNILGNVAAAAHNGHTNTKMVDSVYNVNFEQSKHVTVKELLNEL